MVIGPQMDYFVMVSALGKKNIGDWPTGTYPPITSSLQAAANNILRSKLYKLYLLSFVSILILWIYFIIPTLRSH